MAGIVGGMKFTWGMGPDFWVKQAATEYFGPVTAAEDKKSMSR